MMWLSPFVIALSVGILPKLEDFRNPRIPGEIRFERLRPSLERDGSVSKVRSPSPPRGSGSGWLMDWFYDRFDDLMSWDHNPWRLSKRSIGSHYFELMMSTNPKDQALAEELRRLGGHLHEQVLERYPELMVPSRNVPAERNGFLKWLELAERFPADPSRPGNQPDKALDVPKVLINHLNGKGPWDRDAARSWLAEKKELLDQIRSIGLMPEQSISGIDIERLGFPSIRFAYSCAEALLIDARLAVEEGNLAAAMESVRAARGLANHFIEVETPSLIYATVQIVIDRQVQSYVLSELMPAVPLEQLDPAAWEAALNPQVAPPSTCGRVMKGDWNVMSREFLMPTLADANDPKYPCDPEALIDYQANSYLMKIRAYDRDSPTDWATVAAPSTLDDSNLSRNSREIAASLYVGINAWSMGMARAQSQSGMTQAAFAIMKGEPIPMDPIHGMPYQWDPATRLLSAPDSPVFAGQNLQPITVPKPQYQ